MTWLLQLGKAALLFSGAALVCFLSWFAWTATQTVRQVGFDASVALGSVQRTVDLIGNDAEFVGRPCNSIDAHGKALPQGTLCGVDETLKLTRNAMGRVVVAARHEDTYLDTLQGQEAQLFGDSHRVLGNLADATSTANDVLAGFKPLPGQVTKVVGDIDALATSKDTKATLQGVAGLATHLDATSGDIQTALHPILVPAKCTTRGCRLKRAFAQARAAANTSEALYYTAEVLKLLF